MTIPVTTLNSKINDDSNHDINDSNNSNNHNDDY